ncbi:hypothetical protein D3C78_1721920 [compost metagenome]
MGECFVRLEAAAWACPLMGIAVDDQNVVSGSLGRSDCVNVTLWREGCLQLQNIEVSDVRVERGAALLGVDYRNSTAETLGHEQRGEGLA